jgi:hypothetical protein
MIKAVRMLFIAAAEMVVPVPSATAGQSLSITPPPIAAPTFEEGMTDEKVRFTYVSLSRNGIGRKSFSSGFV